MASTPGTAKLAHTSASHRSSNTRHAWQVVTCDNRTFAVIRYGDGYTNFEDGSAYRVVATYVDGQRAETP